MLQKINPNEFIGLYQQLPAELQDALVSEETTLKIMSIAENQHLTPEQRSVVVDFIGYTFVGKLSPKDFIKELKDELKIDTETAVAVSQEINRQIFIPVRDSLREMYGMETPSITENSNLSANAQFPVPVKISEKEGGLTPKNSGEQTPALTPTTQPNTAIKNKLDLSDIPSKKLNEISDKFNRPFSSFATSSDIFPIPNEPTKNNEEKIQALPASKENNEPINNVVQKTETQQINQDKYQEPIEKKDLSNLPPPPPKIAEGTKLDGNIIDLKAIKPE